MPSIMLVDDDPLLGEIVHHKLRLAGHEVTLVSASEEACATARELMPDLIVLDSMMPILSGPQVLAELKRNPATASIPVIMLTARKGQDDVVQALRAGAEDYLTKPFMPAELALRIASLLARQGSGDRAQAV